MDKDIFFASLAKGKKGRTDFDDTAKGMVWEENRTRYFTSDQFRTLVNYSKILRKLYENLVVRWSKNGQGMANLLCGK